MTTERHVRLFRNGRNQVLLIPREFELDADEALIRKEGDRLIVEPVKRNDMLIVLSAIVFGLPIAHAVSPLMMMGETGSGVTLIGTKLGDSLHQPIPGLLLFRAGGFFDRDP